MMTKVRSALLAVAVSLMAACTDDVTNMGEGIQPAEDAITLGADTFHVTSANYFADYIYSKADSFLLGNYYDATYGSTRAELLAQFACPEGYKFPANAVADSMQIFMYYNTWFGYANAATHIQAYLMDNGTFAFSGSYPSNLNVANYCSKSMLLAERMVSPLHPTDSTYDNSTATYQPFIRMKLQKSFVDDFFANAETNFTTQEQFNNFFKGIYFTTDFGTSTMFYIMQVDMALYYHFSYSKNGQDTTVNDVRIFPANTEVRQVNLFSHADRETVVTSIDSLNYVASPANIFTQITVPTQQMCNRIVSRTTGKRPYVNGADLRVEVADYDTSYKARPASYMLLVRKTALDRFFDKKETVQLAQADTCAMLSALNYTTNSNGDLEYYYSFNLSKVLMQELRKTDATAIDLTTDFMLVPVAIDYSSSSSSSSATITGIMHNCNVTATKIRSAVNTYQPMKISILYSGF